MANVGHRQVGEFPNFDNRRMIRTVKNPMDQATIVSIYPLGFKDIKHTIQPSEFEVPGGTIEKPGVAVFGVSSWWKDMGDEQPMVEIPVSAVAMANSIITDWCNGLIECDMVNAMPGMFFIAGEKTSLEVTLNYKKMLAEAEAKQRNWYNNLIRAADGLWARSQGNPLVIWDGMRLAAKELGVERAWMSNYTYTERVKCFACGSLRDPAYPICPTCKVVDQKHPLAKDLKFAV